MPVKIYVASLFNVIALKTTGGQHTFFGPASKENIYHMIAYMQMLPVHLEGYSDAPEYPSILLNAQAEYGGYSDASEM